MILLFKVLLLSITSENTLTDDWWRESRHRFAIRDDDPNQGHEEGERGERKTQRGGECKDTNQKENKVGEEAIGVSMAGGEASSLHQRQQALNPFQLLQGFHHSSLFVRTRYVDGSLSRNKMLTRQNLIYIPPKLIFYIFTLF